MQLKNYDPFPTTLPIIIEDSTFLYPFMITPLFLTKREDVDAVSFAMENNLLVFIATTRDEHEGSRDISDINRVGCYRLYYEKGSPFPGLVGLKDYLFPGVLG